MFILISSACGTEHVLKTACPFNRMLTDSVTRLVPLIESTGLLTFCEKGGWAPLIESTGLLTFYEKAGPFNRIWSGLLTFCGMAGPFNRMSTSILTFKSKKLALLIECQLVYRHFVVY